jgi:arylformamidase
MFIDITRTLGLDTLTYTGDRPLEITYSASMEEGKDWNTFSLKMTNHTGTHLDAPRHMIMNGKDLNKFTAEDFILECLVIEIKSKKTITLDEIKSYKIKTGSAVLFKTRHSNEARKELNKNFVYLEYDAAKYLKEKKVKLVGIDYLSVDDYYDLKSPVHHLFFKNNILILEDAYLKKVKPGKYKLYCFPIKILNANGAPCRCFLEGR